VSWRWRSELLLDLRMRGCHAHLLGPGWTRESQASASGSGSGAAALSAALSALRLADVDTLPTVARLRVADEYVLHLLVTSTTRSRQDALRQARRQFAQALGEGERRILLLPLDGRHRWLASAIEAADVHAWSDALQQAGLHLNEMRPALFDEWTHLGGQIRDPDAVLVLLRDEGATLMRLIDGLPVDLLWERFDTGDTGTLERRVRAFARAPHGPHRRPAWAQTDGLHGVETAQVIYLLPESGTLCRYVWDRDDGRGAASPMLAAPAVPVSPVPPPVVAGPAPAGEDDA
jgi:hypothetical protein